MCNNDDSPNSSIWFVEKKKQERREIQFYRTIYESKDWMMPISSGTINSHFVNVIISCLNAHLFTHSTCVKSSFFYHWKWSAYFWCINFSRKMLIGVRISMLSHENPANNGFFSHVCFCFSRYNYTSSSNSICSPLSYFARHQYILGSFHTQNFKHSIFLLCQQHNRTKIKYELLRREHTIFHNNLTLLLLCALLYCYRPHFPLRHLFLLLVFTHSLWFPIFGARSLFHFSIQIEFIKKLSSFYTLSMSHIWQ